jgi:hypothetical protein
MLEVAIREINGRASNSTWGDGGGTNVRALDPGEEALNTDFCTSLRRPKAGWMLPPIALILTVTSKLGRT